MSVAPSRVGAFAVALLAAAAFAGCGEDPPLDAESVARYGVPDDPQGAPHAGTAISLGAPTRRSAEPAPAPPADAAPTAAAPRAPSRPRAGGGYKVVPVSNGGTIQGRVVFSGKPNVPTIKITKDQQGCRHESHPSERLVFDEATLGVADCMVSLPDIREGKDFTGEMAAEERTALMDQIRCVYVPHLLLVREGTQVQVKNSDPVEHNIHAYRNTLLTTQFNIMSSSGSLISDSGDAFLERAAKYIVKCDIHPWMNAHVQVVPHPYHVKTGSNGAFLITDVPPGTYDVACWHEGLTERPVLDKDGVISGYEASEDVNLPPQKVTVTAGGTVEIEFRMPPP